jgi:hypothetical protein
MVTYLKDCNGGNGGPWPAHRRERHAALILYGYANRESGGPPGKKGKKIREAAVGAGGARPDTVQDAMGRRVNHA